MTECDIVARLRGRVHDAQMDHEQMMDDAADEIERLRAIVRVNGLRWGHTHAEIDAILAGNVEQKATGFVAYGPNDDTA